MIMEKCSLSTPKGPAQEVISNIKYQSANWELEGSVKTFSGATHGFSELKANRLEQECRGQNRGEMQRISTSDVELEFRS
jgi:hypothetical protein